MELKNKIFRAYDIRGIVGEDIDVGVAAQIGYGYGVYMSDNNAGRSVHVVVGRDNRPSGLDLARAFMQGVRAAGVTVFDAGECPSPFLYYIITRGEFDGGVNITASHNPPEYNGFKLCLEEGHAIFGPELQKIYPLALQLDSSELGEGGLPLEEDYWVEYEAELCSKVKLSRKIKIIVDCAGGVATGRYIQILQAAGAEVEELYPVPDGNFPYHKPDPIDEENLVDLKKKVLESGADMGIAFDGDGDRVTLMSERGEFVDGNQVLVLLARKILKPGDKCVYTVSNSSIVTTELASLGVVGEMCPVGHSYVEHKMATTGALLGGEQSGHIFISKDYYSYDDALVAALHLVEYVANSAEGLSAMLHSLPQVVARPERKIPCSDETKFEVVKKISEKLCAQHPCVTMDGVRVDFGQGGWAGIRASNTSPALSVICEAESEEHLVRIEAGVEKVLKECLPS